MPKPIHWLLDYWYVPLIFIAAVAAYFTFRKWRGGKNPLVLLAEELKIIQSGADARNLQIQVGTEQAVKQIKEKYQAKFQALGATQKAQVLELENDPIALARLLERVSR